MNIANFQVDQNLCVGCGRCTRVCPGGLLQLNEERKPIIRPVEVFGWNGCWRCEHCLAVCPAGAISVLNKSPEASLAKPDPATAEDTMNRLVDNRVSCRRYLHKNVPADIIDDMLSRLACCPNGGNKQLVEYTLIDDVEEMDFLRSLVGEKMDALAERGIFPEGFDRASYEDMKHWEETVRPDMFFCGAPHLLIPHGPADAGEVKTDVNVAGTYFELLCASRGLGAVMMTFPAGVMALMPEVKNLLKIPENHAVGMMIGFGYPEIPYARGMQRRTERSRIHRLKLKQEEVR